MDKAWSVVSLGSLLDVQNGYAFKSKQFAATGGIPLIRIRDLKSGTGAVINYIGEYDQQYVVNNGDLLVGMDGEFRCYEWRGGKALLNQRVCRLRNFSDRLLPKFLLYGINKFLKDIEDVTAFTTVKHLSATTIKAIEFPLPPLEEQRRIVEVLDKAFEGLARARTNAETNLANARELFASASGSEFWNQSDSWPTRSLPQVAENLDRQRVPITKKDRIAGDVPYYGASGVVDRVQGHLFDEDLLLVSEDGANLLTRTYPIAFSISGKTWVNNHAHVLRFVDAADQKYVCLFLNSISLEPYVSGMAQPKLNQRSLNRIPIPWPDAETRMAIVEQSTRLERLSQSLADAYDNRMQDIEELRQSLLQKAFAGELT